MELLTMAKDNLLKEAIADAKAVKEAAIANAMLTLKESFKPQLTSMLAARLRNEADSYDGMEEQKTLDSSDIGTGVTVDEPAPKKPSAVASSSSDIENKGLEVDTFGEGIEDFAQDAPEGEEQFGDAGAGDPAAQGGDEFGDDEFGQGDDLDLEAIIRELEADLMGHGEEGGMDAGEGNPFAGERQEGFNKIDAGNDINAGLTAETLEGDGDEGVHKDGKDQKDTYGVPAGEKVTEGEDEEVDLEEILREVGVDEQNDMSGHITSENVELKRSIREHREVIKLLRNRINEVTLLNSKLMYTTKIFRTFNLSEGQKKKVVEQFDRATTLRETKLVYSTLAESLTGKVGTATPRNVAAKITEGASKSVGSTKPKSQTVLTEGDTQVARMQKLAGIIAR